MVKFNLNKKLVIKVLETVDAGLCNGVGVPVPGMMCVEAAVCYAMGLPHGDEPACVSPALRKLKITLNDAYWSSYEARARGLRKLAILQLGTKGILDDIEFAKKVSQISITKIAPRALRHVAAIHPDATHKVALEEAAVLCEREGTESAADFAATTAALSADPVQKRSSVSSSSRLAAESARSAAYSADFADSADSAADSARSAAYSARSAESADSADAELSFFAEEVANILIGMKVPAVKYLYLTE